MESQAHPPEPESYEDRHVHQVYQQIAPHFSSTRYKPWPIVERFLKELPAGSVGLDVGCGNGKYLAVDANVFIVASDRVGVADQSRTFQRYYHLYRSGELEHDIGLAGGTILDAGYEKDNWWAIAAR
ncbi:MAG: tRNA methyltransferase, has a role in tRNA modification [Thelocarpon impressellum]|nr:MAG: tRNA methyltransferase, has a role in tRNA modification [Thelocarpon impressellum]